MVRGKSDKADAFRIGRYGEEKIKRLEPSKLGILRRVTMLFRGKRSMYLAGGRVQQMLS